MAQQVARDLPWDKAALETGRYGFKLPFENYSTPNTRVRQITRNYKVAHKAYSPSIINLTSWTNLLTYSQALTNAAWTATNITVTDNATTFPDGTVTMSGMMETVANAQHAFNYAFTFTNALQTHSFFVGPNGRNWIRLMALDFGATQYWAFFDVARGVVGATQNCTAGMLLMSDGSYRCWITFTPAAGGGSFQPGISTDGSTLSYIGVTTNGLFIGGAQLNLGASPGAYVSTTAAARTVLAPDVDALVNPVAEDADPLAYQCQETSPQEFGAKTGLLIFSKTYCRIPPNFTTPSSYLFTAPNYSVVSFNYIATAPAGYVAPSGTYWNPGNYAVLSGLDTSNVLAPVIGYYGVTRAITAYTGSPATTLTIPGHNYAAGMLLMYKRTAVVGWFYFNISSVVGGTSVTGVSTYFQNSILDTIAPVLNGIISTVDTVRLRTRVTTDTGQVLTLNTRVLEQYYLPGVTPGINVSTDILPQNQFNPANYLAAWESLLVGTPGMVVDGIKVVPFTGRNGLGTVVATNMLAGDKIVSIWNVTGSADATTLFNNTQLNQLTQLSAANLSANSYLATVLTSGTGVWFNIQADNLAVWMGSILVQKYTQALLASNLSGF